MGLFSKIARNCDPRSALLPCFDRLATLNVGCAPKATKALGNPRAADVHAVRDRRPPTRSKPALLEVYRPNIPKNSSIRYFSVSYHTELPLS
jgi:hypothetical protein